MSDTDRIDELSKGIQALSARLDQIEVRAAPGSNATPASISSVLECALDPILGAIVDLERDVSAAGIRLTRDQPEAIKARLSEMRTLLIRVQSDPTIPKGVAAQLALSLPDNIVDLQAKLARLEAAGQITPATVEAAALALTHHAAEFASGDL